MAANQSIKELMAAETKASKIISEARQGLHREFCLQTISYVREHA
jgi:hypothetical protein